ncbi:MFS transporter, partial [Streptomyces sp. 2MCAF27]
APLAGRWADRGLARPMSGAAFAVAALASAVAGFGQHSVVLIALAAILLDMAVQTTLILGQHTVYRLDPAARARLNSAFIAIFFAGGALGSQLGSLVYRAGGWAAVAALGAVLPVLALLYWTTEHWTAEHRTTEHRTARRTAH